MQRAPFVRMADRYAVGFLIFTLALAGAAWLASGDPVRALAVMVVATPCPLILAAPIAFIAGVSRAARRGIIVKGSGVIEALGRADTVLLDKTGTITLGRPEVARVTAEPGWSEDEVLGLAASLERLSSPVLAQAVFDEAQRPRRRHRPGRCGCARRPAAASRAASTAVWCAPARLLAGRPRGDRLAGDGAASDGRAFIACRSTTASPARSPCRPRASRCRGPDPRLGELASTTSR